MAGADGEAGAAMVAGEVGILGTIGGGEIAIGEIIGGFPSEDRLLSLRPMEM